MIDRDTGRYRTLLEAMASLSGLFSSNSAPYIDSRFAENLFIETTGAIDLTRVDKSFDAIVDGDIGVGIKTFLGGSGSWKKEKIAEFTSLARNGEFAGIGKHELVQRVVEARNTRVISDANEYGINLDRSVYHCLIRLPGGAVIHEEPYRLIDVSSLKPTDSRGNVSTTWGSIASGVHFTDGLGVYTFSTSKNVLLKAFVFDPNDSFIPLDIHPTPLDVLEAILGRKPSSKIKRRAVELTSDLNENEESMRKGIDYVVLPLYSTRSHVVPRHSGINQWNAGGRDRRFGEAYVPIPSEIHQRFPTFFPERNTPFELILPNLRVPVQAKVCQDGGKALMTNPNYLLGKWLISVLMPHIPDCDFDSPPGSQEPIEYADLQRIEKDSVIVKRLAKHRTGAKFGIEFAPVGSYEDFISD